MYLFMRAHVRSAKDATMNTATVNSKTRRRIDAERAGVLEDPSLPGERFRQLLSDAPALL